MSRIAEANLPDYGYPSSPGFRERGGTSQEAAEIMGNVAGMRQAVLAIIRTHASTADEVAEKLGLSVLSVRPRVSELKRFGRIIHSGQRRKNASGVNAAVWMERRK